MAEESKISTKWYSFLNQQNLRSKISNEIWRERSISLWWGVWIGHLVHVAILTPHREGFPEKSQEQGTSCAGTHPFKVINYKVFSRLETLTSIIDEN